MNQILNAQIEQVTPASFYSTIHNRINGRGVKEQYWAFFGLNDAKKRLSKQTYRKGRILYSVHPEGLQIAALRGI